MTVIIIFIGLIIGLNCIPLLTTKTFSKLEKVLRKILFASTTIFLTVTLLAFKGYSLKGPQTFSIISWIFILSTISYFAFCKNSTKKVITIFLLTPLIVISIVMFIFGQLIYENKIDDTYNITVTTGGFMGCGENICITQTRFVIFNKNVFHIGNICLSGINKIETIKLDEKWAEFLIYHNGQYHSDNPYRFELERKNKW